MVIWTYKNKSGFTAKNEPTRDITWSFHIPFILKIRGTHGWQSFLGSIRFLIFGIHYARHLFTGRVLNVEFWPWTIEFKIGWGHKKSHLITFWIGVHKIDYFQWKEARIMRKMTPEQLARMKQILTELVSTSEESDDKG